MPCLSVSTVANNAVASVHCNDDATVPCFRDSTSAPDSSSCSGYESSSTVPQYIAAFPDCGFDAQAPCDSNSASAVTLDANVLGSQGNLEVPASTGTTKRHASTSMLECVIDTCNDEVDNIVSHTGVTAAHVGVMGTNDLDGTASADARIAALREQILARMIGKQRRLDTG